MKLIKLNNMVKIFQFLILTAFSHTSIYAKNTSEIRIAVAFSEDNKYDLSSQQMVDGIRLAKSIFEKQYSEYKIDLITYTFKPHNSASVAKTAEKICKASIPVVIGAEMSEEAIVLGDILNACQVILLSPTATNSKVSENKPYIFTMSASDDSVSQQLALFVHERFRNLKVGVIHNISLPYPDGLTKSFVNHYSRLTSNKIITKKVLRETADYSKEINDFILNDVSVIVMLTYDIDLKRFSSQAAERNYYPVYIGSDGWGSDESVIKYVKSNPAYKNKFTAYRNICWKSDSKTNTNEHFKAAFFQNFNKKANAFNAIGFDSAWVVLNAFKQQNEFNDGKSLRDKLASIHGLQLTTSNTLYFRDNIPIREIYIYEITPEKIKHVATVGDK